MAHKKTKKKVSGTRRKHHRRVGAIKPGGLEHYALLTMGGIVGGVAAAYGVQAANTALSSTAASTPWLPPAMIMGAGAGVAVLSKGSAIGEGFGLGMAAVSGVMVANQTFLNVPGISGMAFTSNAGPANNVIRKAVGQAPGAFINKTVGAMSRRQRAMGALATN